MTTNTWSWQPNHVRVRVRDDDVDDDDDDDDNDAGVGVVARVRVNVAGTSSKGCSGASGGNSLNLLERLLCPGQVALGIWG